MDSHALNPFGSHLKAYILEATGLSMSSMSFLIEDVIQFVSCTMTTFSQDDGTKIKSKQFSAQFDSQTNTITHEFYLVQHMPLCYNMAEMNWVSLQFDIHILYKLQ